MQTMKILMAIVLWALFGLSSVALAKWEADPGHSTERMVKKLDLDENQAQKVRAIMQEAAEKRRALEEETQQRLSKILSPEQMQRLDRRSHDRHGRRGEHMAQELNLTPEQKTAVEKIFADTHSQHEALEKANLEPEQKRAQIEALHTKTREKLATILKPEQLARLDEMHARHMSRRDRMGKREERREHRSTDDAPKLDEEQESAPELKQ